jgi:hypothetical protein
MMRTSAGFENHFRWCKFGKERFDLRTPDLASKSRAFLTIDPVDCEYMFGRIDRNSLKLHRTALSSGWLLDLMLASLTPLGRPPCTIGGVW